MREKQRRGRQVGLLILGIAAFLSFAGASDPRHPLVMRTDSAQGPVPVECETGLSLAPTLRVDLRDVPLPEPEPTEAAPPPSGSLRAALADTQSALAANDRTAFDDAFVQARAQTEAHPAGGERRAAEELVRIYDGARRLWDAQFQSPFFGEDSAEYAAVSAYPGYAEAMRRNTITDASGRRFYPAVESRAFLAGIAADRLRSLGVRAPARPPRTERTPAIAAADTAPLPPIRPRSTAAQSTTSSSRRPATTASPRRPTGGTSRPRTTTASAAPTPTRSSSSASKTPPTRKPAVATTTSSMPNPSTSPTATAVPKPAAPPVATPIDTATASSPAAGSSTSPAPTAVPPTLDEPTDTALTETPPATETTLTTPPATSTTAPAPVPADTRPLRSRSVVLPTILILIGLAVLIVLFRSSK